MNHRHFLVRLFADHNTVEEVESRDHQIAAMQEETGRGLLLALGGFSTDGTAFAKRFPNHRPGAPMAGLMIVVATLVAAAEDAAPSAPEVTFAPDASGLLDQLNQMEREGAIAVVLLGNGSTFVREFGVKLTLTQAGSEHTDDDASGAGDTGDQTDLEQGDLLAGQPDVPPAAPGMATETTEGTTTGIDFSMPDVPPAAADPAQQATAPATAGRKARASKET